MRAAAIGVGLALGASLSPAATAQAGGVQVWYRAGEGCPSGDTFIARLIGLGRNARLASVGDRVDFVVTLAGTPTGASGRLERQTERGQMAVRDIDAPLCAEVAEGLALSLDLALEPVGPPEPRLDQGPERDASAGERRQPGAGWALGARGTWLRGVAPAGLLGVDVFVDWAASSVGPSLRAGTRASQSSGALSAAVDVEVTLITARAEGCPLGWSLGDVSLRPCLGLDLGGIRAKSPHRVGRADSGAWASAGVVARGAWLPSLPVELEVSFAALAPFVRYQLGAEGGEPLYRTRPLALEASVGVAWRLP